MGGGAVRAGGLRCERPRVVNPRLGCSEHRVEVTRAAQGMRAHARRVDGQVDAERRALAHLRLHFDPPLVVLDDLLADRQAQARALGLALLRRALGGEERLEDLREQLLGDARAGVDHLDANFEPVVRRGGLDRERAAFAEHGLAGVDQQVQQDLLELDRVAVDVQARLDLHAKGDAVLLRIAGEDEQRLVDQLLDRDVAEASTRRGPGRASTCRSSRPCSSSGSLGQRLLDQLHVRLVALGALQRVLRVADDRREQVVELVRDDRRDRADRRQPLGFGELFLQRVELRLHLGNLADQGLIGHFEKWLAAAVLVTHVTRTIGPRGRRAFVSELSYITCASLWDDACDRCHLRTVPHIVPRSRWPGSFRRACIH